MGCFSYAVTSLSVSKAKGYPEQKPPSRHAANGLTKHDKHFISARHAALLLKCLFYPECQTTVEIPLNLPGFVDFFFLSTPHFIFFVFHCQQCCFILWSTVDPNTHAAPTPPPDLLSKHITPASLPIASYLSLLHHIVISTSGFEYYYFIINCEIIICFLILIRWWRQLDLHTIKEHETNLGRILLFLMLTMCGTSNKEKFGILLLFKS